MSHHHEQGEERHDFGALTPYEQTLFFRSQLMDVATKIYCSGVPRGRGDISGPNRKPFFTPKEAVKEAESLIQDIDDIIISCRRSD